MNDEHHCKYSYYVYTHIAHCVQASSKYLEVCIGKFDYKRKIQSKLDITNVALYPLLRSNSVLKFIY